MLVCLPGSFWFCGSIHSHPLLQGCMEVLVFKYSVRPARHIGVLDPIGVYRTDTAYVPLCRTLAPLPPSIDPMGMSSHGRRVPRVVERIAHNHPHSVNRYRNCLS